jgi:20S proteasome alpha/beta subunit
VNRTTLIIGLKIKDGVVLIGDTKITDGTDFHHEEKIVAPLEGTQFAIGSAGITQLSKEFNAKVKILLEQRVAEYRLMNMKTLYGSGIDIKDIEKGKIKDVILPFNYTYINFLDDCSLLTKSLADNGKVYSSNPIESLVAFFDGQNRLYQIDCNGFKVEVPYSSIGRGTDFIGEYIKENYKSDMSLNEAVLLATFLIKFVEVLKFDKNKSVGLEKGKLPQVFIVSKSDCKVCDFSGEETKKILKEAEKRVKKISKNLSLFNVKRKVESPISSIAKGKFY